MMWFSTIKPFVAPIISFIKEYYIFILAILAIGFILYARSVYMDKLETIDNLTAQNKSLQLQVETRDLVIIELNDNIKQINEIKKEVAKENTVLRQRTKNLLTKFEKNDRDFGKLLYNKPELVQKIINQATKERLNCAKSITENDSTKCAAIDNNWLR